MPEKQIESTNSTTAFDKAVNYFSEKYFYGIKLEVESFKIKFNKTNPSLELVLTTPDDILVTLTFYPSSYAGRTLDIAYEKIFMIRSIDETMSAYLNELMNENIQEPVEA